MSPEDRKVAEAEIQNIEKIAGLNPLSVFEPHSPAQALFMDAQTPVVAAFAGNQFGKSTSLVVRALRECLPVEFIPQVLLKGKRFGFDEPCHGWILCPSNDKIYDSIFPALREWAPREALHKGDLDSAYDKQHRLLRFARGDTIAFKTYEMEPDKLGGATLHWVGYDEPPPRLHRDECVTRLLRHSGFEMYAMTPLKTNTGWIKRDIYKQRESPDITVIRGSMHDNKLLPKESVERTLNSYANDLWRRAREFGDFVEVSGMVYPDWERCVVDPFTPEQVKGWDIVIGIDPGIRNAGFAFLGFDGENRAFLFDDALLQDKTAADYAALLKERQGRWGYEDPLYIIDPAARSRGQTNAETMLTALSREDIYSVPGQNDVEAGVMQLRTRMDDARFFCSSDCRRSRDAADEYALEDREDGAFKPVKNGMEHVLDACRYGVMARPWYPEIEEQAPDRQLGWVPGQAPKASMLKRPRGGHPMGSLA